MQKNVLKQVVLTTGALLALHAGLIQAADQAVAPPPPNAAAPKMAYGHPMMGMDWVAHTQRMLKDLKTKLNLAPAQQGGWDSWSKMVVDNAKAQSERIQHWHQEHLKQGGMVDPVHAGLTTPERMEAGLEHMKTEVKRMQDHVALLETAIAGTKAFYATLDTNQKTIFDLYWQQSYQEGWGAHAQMHHGVGMGTMPHGAGLMMHPGPDSQPSAGGTKN